jgi:transposase
MSKALSVDLLDRVIAAVEGGTSCRQAAARFGVSESSAIRWRSRLRTQGDVRPGPLGGDHWSGRIERHADVILALVERKSDITLAELQTALAEQGMATSLSSLWRFFMRRRITPKKVGACGRTEPSRSPDPATGMVQQPA